MTEDRSAGPCDPPNLRDQILAIGRKQINPEFVKACGLPPTVNELAERAFVYSWPESQETRAIRRAWKLLNVSPGYIDAHEKVEDGVAG